MFDLVDIAIVLLVVLGVIGGYRRGLVPSACQYGGLVLGVLGAGLLAPRVLDALGLYDPNSRPLSAALMLLLGGCVGLTVGFWVGEPLRRRLTRRDRPSRPDRAFGALTSFLAIGLIVWFLGLSFSNSTDAALSSMADSSRVARTIDRIAPDPPGFLGGVEHTVAAVPFPSTFFPGQTGGLPAPVPIPAGEATQPVQSVAQDVYRVEGEGCGGLVTGSAYPVAPDFLVTNAHVVAGTGDTRVMEDDQGLDVEATTVFFDEKVDVAILHVPGLNATVPATATAQRGSLAFVIGYPGGGSETVAPAGVDGEADARFDDIYNEGSVTRQIWVFSGTVRPGNSGGPLVNAQGQVLGVVFAASSQTGSTQAYALSDQQIAADVSAGVNQGAAVDTASMACAV